MVTRRMLVGALVLVGGLATALFLGSPRLGRAAGHWWFQSSPAAAPVVVQAPAPIPQNPAPAPAPAPVVKTPTPGPAPASQDPAPAPKAPAPAPKDPAPAPKAPAPVPGDLPKPLRLVSTEKVVALTFDDGPTSYNQELVAILQAEKVPAAFFWIGQNVKPGQAEALEKLGFQVGSHTWAHARMTTLDPAAQKEQLDKSLKALGSGIQFFRPPYGAYDPQVLATARAEGLTVVMWDVDSRDWDLADHPEQIAPNIMSHVRPGSVILMHERAQTVKVLPEVIKELRAAGYSFVGLPSR